ncbi:GNAT family N-acetyltransferase [Maritimibacter sp. UBA3975]|uniref:GNAT family N-acetyltransferase n=1 Tax=Maritimibacter sp. UBA3975 TaxID=1946833 RepID=UPI000C0A6EDF|nr:GNAT family N-acetyltransferase [Maritimibacter sp. UBA3975]MAM61491.1 GNAT family N-acetyltransferase [Maritimibacter sp.]|tara:strand:- start:32196 stop:32690 length:495 start_codon:yes stop_codon:yes gene_type:complete
MAKSPDIQPYSPDDRDAVCDLAVAAWAPVFELTRQDVPGFVYDAFYPEGWEPRQVSDVGALLDEAPEAFWVVRAGDALAAFAGIKLHPEDRMGEILIIAVAPDHQRKGIGAALMAHCEAEIRAAGADIVMVETVGDRGHAPARRTYEKAGYKQWPVARYFKDLT